MFILLLFGGDSVATENTLFSSTEVGQSGIADTLNSSSTISSMFPNAAILDGLAISGTTAQNNYEETERAVIAWLRENNIL